MLENKVLPEIAIVWEARDFHLGTIRLSDLNLFDDKSQTWSNFVWEMKLRKVVVIAGGNINQ